MGCRSTVFGREPWINTIIGGVAGSIPTKSALATKLAISESIIKRFEIVGSDVHAHISVNYTLPIQCFNADLSITSYRDIAGLCASTGIHAFNGSSIVIAEFPKASTVDPSSFINTNNLTTFIGNNIKIIDNSAFWSSNISSINLDQVEIIYGFGLRNTKIVDMNLPKLISLDTQSIRQNTLLKTFNAPILENITNKNSIFNGCSSMLEINMKKLKVFGNPAVDSSVFLSLKTACKIRVNIALATANSGAPDAALTWAKNNRGAIVQFYDDAGNYVSTL